MLEESLEDYSARLFQGFCQTAILSFMGIKESPPQYCDVMPVALSRSELQFPHQLNGDRKEPTS